MKMKEKMKAQMKSKTKAQMKAKRRMNAPSVQMITKVKMRMKASPSVILAHKSSLGYLVTNFVIICIKLFF